MNKLEKLVYDAVKSNPNVKIKLRNAYQSFFDLLPNQKDYSKNPIQVKEGYFFGFHDVSPFSFDDNKVLANKLCIPFGMPKKGDVLEVGYFPFNGEMGDFVKIGEARTWNYHKGCRLQWAGPDQIIYNDVLEDNPISQVYNTNTLATRSLPFPIDAVSVCGKFGTSFSYGRLEMLMPGYGYPYEDEAYKEQKIPAATGLFIGNLEDGSKELVLSLKDLDDLRGLSDESVGSHHFVTHSLFSPDGRYVSFLDRRTYEHDFMKRWSRLVVYDRETKKHYVAPTNDMVSHYVWNNLNQIIAYCRVGDIDSHVLFEEPTLQQYRQIAYPELNSDGHQSFINTTSFVTDTYPDKYRMANLYAVNADSNKAELLARVNSLKSFQSKPYKHWCCDLHPRMNRKGTYICFDSIHTGERALCTMKI